MARLATAYLSLALAASALAPALAQDGPIATTRDPVKAAAAQSMLNPASAPADDYGYVAWCYGAITGYVDKYEAAMPEVIRIERAFPTPSTEENIKKVYPEQRDAAKASLPTLREAMAAAETASPRPIKAYGLQSQTRGQSIWTGYAAADKRRLGQFWMGWAAPAECESRAKTLKAKSDLMGQALSANATSPGEMLSGAVEPAEDSKPEAAAADTAAAAPSSIDDILAAPPEAPAAEAPAAVAPAVAKAAVKPRPIQAATRTPVLRGTR